METPFSAYQGDEPYVFVCYSHEDVEVVYAELQWLREQGVNLWYDEGISAGKNWRAAIGDSLLGARHVLFYISARSLESAHCNREINLALDEEKDVLPVYLEDVELTPDLKVGLNRVQALHRDQDASYQQHLLNALGKSAQTPVKTDTTDQVDPAAMRSIAVLPFANMSTNNETGFFADGLSEDILDNLAQIEQIKVASRSASFRFRESGQDPSIIGQKLRVAYLLEGSVRQRGDNVRITAQLIRSDDGFQVWSKSYERTLADGFEMQTTVAANIAYITGSRLIVDVLKNYGWKQEEMFDGIDPVAVQHYFNAEDEYLNIRLGEGGDWVTRTQFLKSAVEVDPNFYMAYAWLANAYYQRHRFRLLSLQEARPAAHAAITSSIALAPNNILVQFQLATIHLHLDLDYPRAKAEIKQVLTREPKWGLCHLRLARIALREGRTNEALGQLANASEFMAGTERALFFDFTAGIRCSGGDYEGALKASARGLKIALEGQDRARILRIHARSLVMLGRVEEAKPFLEEGWHLDGSTSPESYIALFANIGEIEKSKKILTDSRFNLLNHNELAMGHLALGDVDNTFNSIRSGIEDHDANLIESLIVAEWWNPIRDDPRFDEMLKLLDSKVMHTEQYLHDQ